MSRRAQTLLLVMFLLILAGALVAGLTRMWLAEIKMRSLGRDGLLAFYLAEAGIERSKAELKQNWAWPGMDSNENNVADDSEKALLGEGVYWVDVYRDTADPNKVTLEAHGGARDAHRVIRVELERIASGNPPTYGYRQVLWSWQEI